MGQITGLSLSRLLRQGACALKGGCDLVLSSLNSECDQIGFWSSHVTGITHRPLYGRSFDSATGWSWQPISAGGASESAGRPLSDPNRALVTVFSTSSRIFFGYYAATNWFPGSGRVFHSRR